MENHFKDKIRSSLFAVSQNFHSRKPDKDHGRYAAGHLTGMGIIPKACACFGIREIRRN